MNFDLHEYPFSSHRNVSLSSNGMVVTSQNLAAEAGLEILRKGGNAIDAAVATAAALTVVEPTSNGIGCDAFAQVWSEGELTGLNASGPAPSSISIGEVIARGYEEMPLYGWEPVTVPGGPGGWVALSSKFGSLPLEEVFSPAIRYAREGFPVSPVVARKWNRIYESMSELDQDHFSHWFEVFAPDGTPPQAGEIWRSEDHATTLQSIAETEGESFYRGQLAREIDKFAKMSGGFLSGDDLASYSPEWVDPLNVEYRGYDIWELPPNGQGLIALMALGILEGFERKNTPDVDTYHKQIEAIKLAFADGKEYITDPDHMEVDPAELLQEEYLNRRRNLISDQSSAPKPGRPPEGGTVYLATADDSGNMVSLIQSNFRAFGSGMVVPETGIALQNRGRIFSLDPEDANSLEGGKRSYHTIIPGFITKDGGPVGPFGLLGGYVQPQGHIQLLSQMLDFGRNPQAALDAPRWKWIEEHTTQVEPELPSHIARSLLRKGHNLEPTYAVHKFGKGQIIWKEKGVLIGATEPRADGVVASY